MTIDEVRNAVHAAPFVPFVLHLADGRAAEIPHPDFIAVTGPGRHVIVTYTTRSGWSVIDLLLVTELEVQAGDRRQ